MAFNILWFFLSTSNHLGVALHHSLWNQQPNMSEQGAINPIYYTLRSNPRTWNLASHHVSQLPIKGTLWSRSLGPGQTVRVLQCLCFLQACLQVSLSRAMFARGAQSMLRVNTVIVNMILSVWVEIHQGTMCNKKQIYLKNPKKNYNNILENVQFNAFQFSSI